MQRFEFVVDREVLIINDLITNGSLRIIFKPLGKPVLSPVYEAWNDLEYSIDAGRLTLQLYGINTIVERRRFLLEGNVILSSSHLYDCVIRNGSLHMVSFKQRTYITNSVLKFMGSNRFGEIDFKNCIYTSNPPQGYFKNTTSYLSNTLTLGN